MKATVERTRGRGGFGLRRVGCVRETVVPHINGSVTRVDEKLYSKNCAAAGQKNERGKREGKKREEKQRERHI